MCNKLLFLFRFLIDSSVLSDSQPKAVKQDFNCTWHDFSCIVDCMYLNHHILSSRHKENLCRSVYVYWDCLTIWIVCFWKLSDPITWKWLDWQYVVREKTNLLDCLLINLFPNAIIIFEAMPHKCGASYCFNTREAGLNLFRLPKYPIW